MVERFINLQVWADPTVQRQLSWYFNVARNVMPAKYLIANRVDAGDFSGMDLPSLWQLHEQVTAEFLHLWSQVKSGKLSVHELPRPSQSLLDLNVEIVGRILRSCIFCRWRCGVDRVKGEKLGTCQLGEQSRVASYFHHRGEELIYRGTGGSGTIFFTSCNMRCVFCQNGSISKDKDNGVVVDARGLAHIIWRLRAEGCHNINFVGGDPIVHLHTIVRAIHFLDPLVSSTSLNLNLLSSDSFIGYRISKQNFDYHGLFNVPLLWNSNFFMSEEALSILRTIMDVWLPDLKFYRKECARFLSRTPWYFETVSKMIKQIYDWGESFSIRHLIMPGHVECCSIPILQWISKNVPDALVNIMDQYHPDSFASPLSKDYNPRYEPISRYPSKEEVKTVVDYAKSMGLNFEAVTYY